MRKYDFFFFWNLLIANWKWMALSALVCMAASYAVSKYLVKPVYSSNVTIFCGRILTDTEPVNSRPAVTEYANSLNIGLQLVKDYRELLKSDRIQDKVLQRAARHTNQKKFYFKVIVNAVKQTRILSIEVQTHDPALSRLMADAYAEAFIGEVQNIMQMQNSQIIDAAKIPKFPIRPRKIKIACLFFILGGFLEYFIAAMFAVFDLTVKTPEDAAELLKLPMLGMIPEEESLADAKYSGNYIFANSDEIHAPLLAEYFRAVRANLQYCSPKKGDAWVYLVTSAVPAEGKSFNAANIAASMAEAGRRVLLLNCDLRKPSLQKLFRCYSESGLVNCLIGEKRFDEVVKKNLFGLPLDVVFCGPITPNPAKLLGSGEFESLIAEQRKNYDYIFLDAPPMLATADVLLMGKYTDAVLMVVRAKFTHTSMIQQVIAELKLAKLNLSGCILNRCPMDKNNSYGYGYSYGYNTYGHYGESHHSHGLKGKIAGLFHHGDTTKDARRKRDRQA